MKKEKKRGITKEYLPLYLMLLPGLLYLLINNYVPMAGIVIAFKKLNFAKGIMASPWAGLDNFKFLFASKDAWIITRNTLLYNVAFIIVSCLITVITLTKLLHFPTSLNSTVEHSTVVPAIRKN